MQRFILGNYIEECNYQKRVLAKLTSDISNRIRLITLVNVSTSSIISKVWSFCNPLRDVGVGYGDYLEQLTYLLFLKMADEYSKPPYNRKLNIPKDYNWESLSAKERRGA